MNFIRFGSITNFTSSVGRSSVFLEFLRKIRKYTLNVLDYLSLHHVSSLAILKNSSGSSFPTSDH